MADFFVAAPDATKVTGTSGDDQLFFTLATGPGGVSLDGLTPDSGGGYSGTFNVAGPNDTPFSGIENFNFHDRVGGADTITTGGGRDTLNGGGGNDILRGGAGQDLLHGNAGRDKLYGGDDFDQIEGGNGNDRLFGEGANDSLIGGAGNDRIFGGAGDDFIDGGSGNDLIKGGAGSDFIIADSGNDRIFAGAGDDFLETDHAGVKTIDGGSGKDVLFTFFNGLATGDATLDYNMGTGLHRVIGPTVTQSTIKGVEDYGMVGVIDAKITGDRKNNVLSSDMGDDVLSGAGGGDTLFGGGGNDSLSGNRGKDRLNGADGNDTLRGGGGADIFEFDADKDRIKDFRNDIDTIEIDAGLVAKGTTVQDIIDGAKLVGGNTVLNFGGGDVLTIEGLGNAALLGDDLVIV